MSVAAALFAARARAFDEPSVEGQPPIEVVVQGRRSALQYARTEPTVASTVLSEEELSEVGRGAGEVLARVPGVQVTRTGAQSDLTTASIRGADASQVPVYLAGVRINDEVLGSADLSSIPLFLMHRVEVYRGNAPELSDRMGPGGAILFSPRLPKQTGVSVGGQLGSFGQRARWASAEAGSAQNAVLAAVRDSRADNDYSFVDDQGQRFDLDERAARRQNADFSQRDFWFIHQYRQGGMSLRTVLNGLSREQGVTGLSVIPARSTRSERSRWLWGTSAQIPCGPLGCVLTLDSQLLVARQTIFDPRVELPSLRTRRLHAGAERAAQSIRWSLYPTEALHLSLSALASADLLRMDRQGGQPRRGRRRTLLPKARIDWELGERFSLHGLAALECHQTRGVTIRLRRRLVVGAESTCDVQQPTGRLGAKYALSDEVALLSNVGRHIRVPTLSELYGTSAAVEGTPELLPETGVSFDAGARVQHGGAWPWSAEVFGFRRTVQQLIRYRRSSVESLAAFNVASAIVSGLEWNVAMTLEYGLRLQSSGTWLRARETTEDPVLDPTANDELPNTAPLTWTVGASQTFSMGGRLSPLDQITVHASYLHRAERFSDPAGLHRLAPQDFVDVGLGFTSLNPRIELSAALRNLTDSRSSDLIGLPVPGRSAHASLQAWF